MLTTYELVSGTKRVRNEPKQGANHLVHNSNKMSTVAVGLEGKNEAAAIILKHFSH